MTPSGSERVQRIWIERKACAAVLHQDSGRGQHAAGTELPVDRLDVGDDKAARISSTHPHRVAVAAGKRPARRFAPVDLHGFTGNETRLQAAVERVRETTRIGEDAVAGAKRALGRFDQAMDVIEPFRLGHA